MIVHRMCVNLAVPLLDAVRMSDENDASILEGKGGYSRTVTWKSESGMLIVAQWEEIPSGLPGRDVTISGRGVELHKGDEFLAPPWIRAVVLYDESGSYSQCMNTVPMGLWGERGL